MTTQTLTKTAFITRDEARVIMRQSERCDVPPAFDLSSVPAYRDADTAIRDAAGRGQTSVLVSYEPINLSSMFKDLLDRGFTFYGYQHGLLTVCW